MNVRITPRGQGQATWLYGGIGRVVSDGDSISLEPDPAHRHPLDEVPRIPLFVVAEIALDEEPGDFFW